MSHHGSHPLFWYKNWQSFVAQPFLKSGGQRQKQFVVRVTGEIIVCQEASDRVWWSECVCQCDCARHQVLRISQPYPGDFFSVIAVIGCRESRPCKMLRAIHFSPLPCSDLGQGVAISTTAFMLPRFFVQTHIFSVSPSSFSL